MTEEDKVFSILKRTPWINVWYEFILSGDDDANHHVLEKHGWTYHTFLMHGIEYGHIQTTNYE